jgi:hypothetical protein
MNCTYCDEPVYAGEQSTAFPSQAMHTPCAFRMAVGSVAHVLRRCHCFQPGSQLNDPPGLTKRQAARAALDLFQQIELWYDGEAV